VIAARVLDQRALNRALLARQLLLEPRGGALAGALERIGGIQAQYAPSMYVGAWSRIQGLERETVTRALERRRVVQGTLLRATIHLVSPRDWWPWTIATREERRKRWLSYHKGDPSAREMAAAARRVAGRLEAGPVTRAELLELVGKGPRGVTGINLWLDLVRIPPSGTWDRRRADLFADARRWIGSPP